LDYEHRIDFEKLARPGSILLGKYAEIHILVQLE
jgi:hypothetical protein